MAISEKERKQLKRAPKNSVGAARLAEIEESEREFIEGLVSQTRASAAPVRKHVAGASAKMHANEGILRSPEVTAERARIKSILSNRKHGDAQANHLAFDSDINAEVARGILSIH